MRETYLCVYFILKSAKTIYRHWTEKYSIGMSERRNISNIPKYQTV